MFIGRFQVTSCIKEHLGNVYTPRVGRPVQAGVFLLQKQVFNNMLKITLTNELIQRRNLKIMKSCFIFILFCTELLILILWQNVLIMIPIWYPCDTVSDTLSFMFGSAPYLMRNFTAGTILCSDAQIIGVQPPSSCQQSITQNNQVLK